MSRRTVALSALVTTLAAGGLVPSLLVGAHAADSVPAANVLPRAGCFTVADVTGDATSTTTQAQDDDLDLTGLTFQSTVTTVKAFVGLKKLATKAANATGHTFYVYFTVGGKDITFAASQYDPSQIGSTYDSAATAASREPNVRMRVGGTYVSSTIKADFDQKNSTVVFSISPDDFKKASGVDFVAGAPVTKVLARTASSAGPVVGGWYTDSTAKDNGAAGTDTWTAGDNKCFTVPTAIKLAVLKKGTARTVTATLTAAGKGLAKQPLTVFANGKKVATIVTDATGKASYTKANPSQTIKVDFLGASGYDPSTASTKV